MVVQHKGERDAPKASMGPPFEAEIDFCSKCGLRPPNEDYALYDKRVGICVADGIGSAPLGDALARYACHVAMEAMKTGMTACPALEKASDYVTRFVAIADSPGSGTSLMVARLANDMLDVAWVGNIGLFVLERAGRHAPISSTLELGDFPRPLGNGHPALPNTIVLPLEIVDKIALCTDGAWKEVGPEAIGGFLAEDTTPRRTAARIVLGHPSKDDSTALVASMRRANPTQTDCCRG